jgi:isopropylmalate/homocitrate/citramalate synthase
MNRINSRPYCGHYIGDDILKTVDYALGKGLTVNVYLEDWSNGYRDNRDYVFALMDSIQRTGISHFMLPDTYSFIRLTPCCSPSDTRAEATSMRSTCNACSSAFAIFSFSSGE